METLVEHLPEQEKKSFDIESSVNMFRRDLIEVGFVRDETKERVLEEDLSLVVEGIDKPSQTTFVLKRENNELVYYNDGKWQPYLSMLYQGHQIAKREAEIDPRKTFKLNRASDDLLDGYKMQNLSPGERHSWSADFPREETEKFGETFIKSEGFNPNRKLGFLYQAICNEDGSVTLQSQTVDRCELGAFKAVEEAINIDPELDIDGMTRVYDGYLSQQYGGYFFAGRREAEVGENAWQDVLKQRRLIEYHLIRLEEIARLPKHEIATANKIHLVSLWSMFEKNIIGKQVEFDPNSHLELTSSAMLVYRQAADNAFNEFLLSGKPLIACGGELIIEKTMKDILEASDKELFESVFGRKKSAEYSFDKKMYCQVCQKPPKKGETKKYCEPCGYCQDCDKKAAAKP